jgi:hypothetical protein
VKEFTAVDVEGDGLVAGSEAFDEPANPCCREQDKADNAYHGALEGKAHTPPHLYEV